MGTCKTLLVGYGITSQYQLLVNLMRFKKYKKNFISWKTENYVTNLFIM